MSALWEVFVWDGRWNKERSEFVPAVRYLPADLTCGECVKRMPPEESFTGLGHPCPHAVPEREGYEPACMAFVPKGPK